MKHQINKQQIEKIKSELAFDGYVPSKYEIAGAYIQQLDGNSRLALVEEFTNKNQSVIKRIQLTTSQLAKVI